MSIDPTGTQRTIGASDAVEVVHLSAGGYTASITAQGAALRSLRHEGRDLVFHRDAVVPVPQYSGAVLVPWPNRVANGRYRVGDRVHQLPVNEVGRGNALHGLALWQAWTVATREPDSVSFEYVVLARPGYPFTIAARATYRLDEHGLRLEVTATNLGADAAPVGLSAHPYLTVGDGTLLDEWTLRLPCAEVILTDDRLLPRRVAPVAGTPLDYRVATALGAAELDHAYTAMAYDGDGRAAAELVGPGGAGVRVGWSASSGWVQVYTLHVPGDPIHRHAVAIEPMTCAPDALNSGAGLVELAPGGSTGWDMSISAIEPASDDVVALQAGTPAP